MCRPFHSRWALCAPVGSWGWTHEWLRRLARAVQQAWARGEEPRPPTTIELENETAAGYDDKYDDVDDISSSYLQEEHDYMDDYDLGDEYRFDSD